MHQTDRYKRGFTLIELSIVLVTIGLIIGGILIGQELIGQAGVRAQVTQIQKYDAATNAFYGKYGGLPGDLNSMLATQFGFVARGIQSGQGDGNGLIVGFSVGSGAFVESYSGETGVFWEDLSNAKLIDGGFILASETQTYTGATLTSTTSPNIGSILPSAKIGNGNYVYVYSGGLTGGDSKNYFGLSAVSGLANSMASNPGLTVQQAYNIDKKIDDGLAQSGIVTAFYIDNQITTYTAMWAAGGGVAGPSLGSSATGSPTSCYDNAGGTGPMQYSMGISNGNNVNCALSFKMQGVAR